MSDEHEKPHHAAPGGPHRKHEEEEEAGVPEWMISFADNTALLMGFFVILLAMNMAIPKSVGGAPEHEESEVAEAVGQTAAALDWAIAIRAGFNNPVDINSTAPEDRLLVARLRERRRQAEEAQANTNGETEPIPGPNQTSQSLDPSDYHAPVATAQFPLDSAQLTDDGARTLQAAAEKLRDLRLLVEVRGYVSPFEALEAPAQGMQLSFARAMAAAEQLVEAGMKWEQLRLIACGDTSRQREYDLKRQAAQQRVDIISTDEAIPADSRSSLGPQAGAAH